MLGHGESETTSAARCAKRCGERSFFLFSRDRHSLNELRFLFFCHKNHGKATALVSKFQTQEGEVRKACLALIASTTELSAAFCFSNPRFVAAIPERLLRIPAFDHIIMAARLHCVQTTSGRSWNISTVSSSHILITGIYWIFLCGHGCSWLSVQTLQVHLAMSSCLEFSCD